MRGARPNQTHHTTPTCPLHNPTCMGSPLEGSTATDYITSLHTYLHTHGWAFTLTSRVHSRHYPTPSSWEVVATALDSPEAARCSYAIMARCTEAAHSAWLLLFTEEVLYWLYNLGYYYTVGSSNPFHFACDSFSSLRRANTRNAIGGGVELSHRTHAESARGMPS